MPTLIGDGTTLSYSTNLTTPAYTLVPGLVSVDGPSFESDEIDAPLLASTFSKVRMGKPKGKSGKFVIEYSSANAFVVQAMTWYATGPAPTVLWKLVLEDGGSIVWQGAIGGFTIQNLEEGGRVKAEFPFSVQTLPVVSTT